MNPFRTSFKHLPGRHDQMTHGNRGVRHALRAHEGQTDTGNAPLREPPAVGQSETGDRERLLAALEPLETTRQKLGLELDNGFAERLKLQEKIRELMYDPTFYDWPERESELSRQLKRSDEITARLTEISLELAANEEAQKKAALDALASPNPHPPLDLTFDNKVSLESRAKLEETVNRVLQLVPADRPFANSERYGGDKNTDKTLRFIVDLDGRLVGAYEQSTNEIFYTEPTPYVIAHEVGHWIEATTPGAREAAYAYLERKSGGLTEEQGKRTYFIDAFVRDYMGRFYKNAQWETTATELISTGIEELFTKPYRFAKFDPESFDMVMKLIRGKIGLAQKHLRGRHDQMTHGNRGVRARFLPDPEDVLGIDPSDRVARGEAKYRTPVPGSPREKIMNELGEAEVLRERLTNELTKTLKEVRLAGRKRFDYERYYNRSGEYGSDFSSHPEWVKARDDHEALEKKATEMITALSQIQKEQVEKVIAILAVPNSYPVLIGTRLQDTKHSSFTEEDRAIIAKTTEQVMRLIPANRPTQIPPELKVKLDPTKQIQLDMSSFPDSNYGQYNVMFNSIALVVPQSHILAHELGHWAASVFPGIFESEHEFLKLKSRGRKVSKFGRVFYPDSYVREYTGRVYPNSDGKVSATEFLSTSLEEIFTRPYYFAKHFPASFDLAIKLLRGET